MLIRYPRGFDHLPGGFPDRRVLCSSRRRPETKNPACFHMPGFQFWRRPIDSLTPDRSPAARAGLTVYLAVPNRSVLCSSRRHQNKTPSTSRDMLGALFWRRPTLARPIAVLPSGLQRFTSVFGMGTGGATALLSPEVRAGTGT